LADTVLPHTDDAGLAERMTALYAEVDRSIEKRRPVCRNRGVCCRFDSFGHRLYVTTAELAFFVAGQREDWKPTRGDGACPYQEEGLCTAREHRPLGCRVFFCDPDAQDWQSEEYERGLAALKGVCRDSGLEYRYVEWLSALGALDGALKAERPNDAIDPATPGVISSGETTAGDRSPARRRLPVLPTMPIPSDSTLPTGPLEKE